MKLIQHLDKFAITLMLAALTGCMPKMTVQEMKNHIPERPIETDRLADWIGTWQSEGTAKFASLDRALNFSGTERVQWGPDKWFITAEGDGTMEELGSLKSLETWTYDMKSNVYRSTWTDNQGHSGYGTATFEPTTRTWHITGTMFGPHGKTCGKGKATFVTNDTIEWTWTEYAFLSEVATFAGSSQRRGSQEQASTYHQETE
jgi:hypothetical protein